MQVVEQGDKVVLTVEGGELLHLFRNLYFAREDDKEMLKRYPIKPPPYEGAPSEAYREEEIVFLTELLDRLLPIRDRWLREKKLS